MGHEILVCSCSASTNLSIYDKLAPHYKLLAAGATLIQQSSFLCSQNAEKDFIEFKGGCHFKFKRLLAAK
jgi:hypothetical protein